MLNTISFLQDIKNYKYMVAKIRLILFISFMSMLVIVYTLFKENMHIKRDNIRLKTNQTTLIKQLNDRAVTITNRELSEMYSNILQKFKEYNINSKRITNYINYEYKYKDSIKTVLLKDTIKNNYHFIVDKDCYSIKGTIVNDSISTNISLNDSIDIIIYKKRNTDYSWWYRLWHPSARWVLYSAVYSNCKKDTIMVKRFLNVER